MRPVVTPFAECPGCGSERGYVGVFCTGTLVDRITRWLRGWGRCSGPRGDIHPGEDHVHLECVACKYCYAAVRR